MPSTQREYPQRPLVGIGIAVLRAPRLASPAAVLLVQRARPPAKGAWSLPGGAQRLGEGAEQAARRELMEETGLAVGALHLAGYVDSIHHDAGGGIQYHYTILDFCALWTAGDPVPGGDAAALRWADLDHLDGDLWTEARRIIQASRHLLGC